MDDKELARAVAAELGQAVATETEQNLSGEASAGDATRGLTEAMAVASFLASCAQVAVNIYQARQDRALLVQALLDGAPNSPRLDPERRLGLIARIVDRLIPESLGASPSLGAQTARTKQEWLAAWLGIGTRGFSPTVLMPFADMDYYIVYRPITWSPPATWTGLPTVTVPNGFVTDLATIPSSFWWVAPPTGRYGHAAILHDWLYWEQRSTRDVADRVFDVAMEELGVALPMRKAMWGAVRTFGGKYWTEAEQERRRGASRTLKRLPDDAAITWEDWRKKPDVFA